ncbi:MAG TPA: metallophosphoesterase, partial [Longimicrobiales bacterium]|nr:metallophosphoesterase [Longimicrobiales bacterium]
GRIAAAGVGRSLLTVRTPDGRSARAYVYVSSAVLVGAGDIAVCGYETDERTAELLDHIAGTIWTAGDNAYPSGTRDNFAECYEPTWGRHRARTRPTPGNHEYRSPGAAPYFEYFGEAAGEPGKGWYSYRYGGWLILALNSNLSELPADHVEEQMEWLRDTLEETPAKCTLAYFHHPLFSSGSHGGNADEDVRPIYRALYDAGADVVLVGHDHHYERFAPLDPDGNLDRARGIRQFLVGTGGGALRDNSRQVHPHSEFFSNNDHGVLEVVLHPDGFEWQFLTVRGGGGDGGRGTCH